MRYNLLVCILLIASASAFSQSLTEKDLQDIRGSFKKDASTAAIQNILTVQSNIKENALNHELQSEIDHFFKYRVEVKGITNQKSSGRCWMFTSMNVLRPSIRTKYNIDSFDFSHNYLYFWDLFEKANLYLENIIATSSNPIDDREVIEFFKSPVGDGGVWNHYYNAALKYGVVPDVVMPETAHSNSTGQMISLINEKLRMEGYRLRELATAGKKEKDLRTEKQAILKEVYRMLALCLGEPPTQFTWRYKTKEGKIEEKQYTPKAFYNEITPSDYSLENYIMVMNDPTREYYKVYDIKNYRNAIEGVNWVYLNLPNEDIKKAALSSIKNNEALYASCDVGKQHNRETGIMDPAGNNGYLTFTDNWFNEYIFRLVIHRKYLDAKAIESLKQKPVELPMWDYMY